MAVNWIKFKKTAGLLAFLPIPLFGQITLPNVISDHAVLQREQPIHIWGTSARLEHIAVEFDQQKRITTANGDGVWEIWLNPEKAGGPFTLKVTGDQSRESKVRQDILVGDVWIASGQSNMEFPLNGFADAPLRNGKEEIAQAFQPQIRLLLQSRRTSPTMLNDTENTWTLCSPATAANFSAVAYFFGRELQGHEHVPIGLIDSTWGGTPAHSWISLDGIRRANLVSVAADAAEIVKEEIHAAELKQRYEAEDAALRASGHPTPVRKVPGDHKGSWTPGNLFNGMIAPFTKYTIRGAIWYQGESDGTPLRAPNYASLFSVLISDWRRQWNQGTFPFLFVQISSYGKNDSGWAVVRNGQRQVSESVAGTGMAVSIDVGDAKNLHPPDKQTVGMRLALLARKQVYGEIIDSDSPRFRLATREGDTLRVWFSAAKGLHTGHTPIGDFEVAGEDHRFMPATATIEGETVLVHASGVDAPRYVRYGWKDLVSSYLYNAAGLPAATFSSEQ